MNQNENSFTAAEYKNTQNAFRAWQTTATETADEYTLRKRKAELYGLVRTVIKNELTPSQQKIVRLLWYENKSRSEAAEILGIDNRTLKRHEEKINNLIFGKLKYAMEYRYGKSFSENSVLLVKSNTRICFPCDGGSIANRLHNLRLQQSLEIRDVATMTGIKPERVEEIESKGEKITVEEISVLSGLFSTTSDFIIFGIKSPVAS